MTINKAHIRIIPLWCMVSSQILMTGCNSTIQTEGIFNDTLSNILASIICALAVTFGGYILKNAFYVDMKIRPWKFYRKLPWRRAFQSARDTANELEVYNPTIIIGIGRGGAIYSSILSYYRKEAAFLALDRDYFYDEHGNRQEDWLYPITLPEELLERVLLVAGEYHSGKTMEKFKARIFEIGAKEIKTCVLYYQRGLKNQVNTPDYYGITKTADYLMPWQASSFLRTWKDGGDAKRREFLLRGAGLKMPNHQ